MTYLQRRGRQTDRQTDTVYRSKHQNITCHAHFVAWQVIKRVLDCALQRAQTSAKASNLNQK